MSSFGLGHPAARGATDVTNNGNGNTGITGPARDAWNNPIKETPEPQGSKSATGGNTNTGADDNIADDDINSIWEAVKKENSGTTDNNNNNNNNNNQQQQQTPDPKKQLDDYMLSVGLDPITFSDAEKEELKSGNFDTMMVRVNQKIANAHVKALSGAQTMVQAAVTKAVEEAVGKSQSLASGERNVSALNQALPFTKDKVIGPVAQTVMQKFLDRGMNTEDAIKGVRKFFDHTAGKVSGNEVNKSRNGSFQSGSGNNGDNENSWLDVLTPQR